MEYYGLIKNKQLCVFIVFIYIFNITELSFGNILLSRLATND